MILLFMYKLKHPRIFLKWLFTCEEKLHQLRSKLKFVGTILFQSLFLKKHNAIICDILHCNHPYIFLSLCEVRLTYFGYCCRILYITWHIIILVSSQNTYILQSHYICIQKDVIVTFYSVLIFYNLLFSFFLPLIC